MSRCQKAMFYDTLMYCTFLLTCKKVCAVVGMWALAMVSLLVWCMAPF